MPSTQPINDGGPAFVVPDSHHLNGEVQYGSNGMSLRDWLAGLAMQSMIGPETIKFRTGDGTFTIGTLPDAAYAVADAMIKARKVAT